MRVRHRAATCSTRPSRRRCPASARRSSDRSGCRRRIRAPVRTPQRIDAGVVEPGDVRMLERGEDVALAGEPFARPGAKRRGELQRHLAPRQRIGALGEPHRAHAAVAERKSSTYGRRDRRLSPGDALVSPESRTRHLRVHAAGSRRRRACPAAARSCRDAGRGAGKGGNQAARSAGGRSSTSSSSLFTSGQSRERGEAQASPAVAKRLRGMNRAFSQARRRCGVDLEDPRDLSSLSRRSSASRRSGPAGWRARELLETPRAPRSLLPRRKAYWRSRRCSMSPAAGRRRVDRRAGLARRR